MARKSGTINAVAGGIKIGSKGIQEMLPLILVLFVVIPSIELVLLYNLAQWTSWPMTFALVLITGIVGGWLARQQGVQCWNKAKQKLACGELPTDSLLDGIMILIAGVLLVTPGVLTDLVGLALLIPLFRHLVRRRLATHLRSRLTIIHPPGTGPFDDQQHDQIIDVRVIDSKTSESDEGN